jgi:hypothetical protein
LQQQEQAATQVLPEPQVLLEQVAVSVVLLGLTNPLKLLLFKAVAVAEVLTLIQHSPTEETQELILMLVAAGLVQHLVQAVVLLEELVAQITLKQIKALYLLVMVEVVEHLVLHIHQWVVAAVGQYGLVLFSFLAEIMVAAALVQRLVA